MKATSIVYLIFFIIFFNSCSNNEQKKSINWEERLKWLLEDIEPYRKSSGYECIIGVSGGKDSYYQTHLMVKDLGLKPLLMTYHGNNFLPEGDFNRDQMRHNFNADHIVWGPSIDVLKKLNNGKNICLNFFFFKDTIFIFFEIFFKYSPFLFIKMNVIV